MVKVGRMTVSAKLDGEGQVVGDVFRRVVARTIVQQSHQWWKELRTRSSAHFPHGQEPSAWHRPWINHFVCGAFDNISRAAIFSRTMRGGQNRVRAVNKGTLHALNLGQHRAIVASRWCGEVQIGTGGR